MDSFIQQERVGHYLSEWLCNNLLMESKKIKSQNFHMKAARFCQDALNWALGIQKNDNKISKELPQFIPRVVSYFHE